MPDNEFIMRYGVIFHSRLETQVDKLGRRVEEQTRQLEEKARQLEGKSVAWKEGECVTPGDEQLREELSSARQEASRHHARLRELQSTVDYVTQVAVSIW